MKYFVLAGWSKNLKKEVYWHEETDGFYNGWQESLTEATILDKNLLEWIMNDEDVIYRSERLDVRDLKKIEVKLGEWENIEQGESK